MPWNDWWWAGRLRSTSFSPPSANFVIDMRPDKAYSDAAGTVLAVNGDVVRNINGAVRNGTSSPATFVSGSPDYINFAGPAQSGTTAGYVLPAFTLPWRDFTLAVVVACDQTLTADGSTVFTLGDWGNSGGADLWCYISGPYLNLRSNSGIWEHRFPFPADVASFGVLLATASGTNMTFAFRGLSSLRASANWNLPNSNVTVGSLGGLFSGAAIVAPYNPRMKLRRAAIVTPGLSADDQQKWIAALAADAGAVSSLPAQAAGVMGDSRAFGSNTSGQGSYPAQLSLLLTNPALLVNYGQPGAFVQDMPIGGDSAVKTVALPWSGFNNLNTSGESAATVIARVTSRVVDIKAAGWPTVVWLNEPIYSAAAGGFDARRLTYNATLNSTYTAMGLAAVVDISDLTGDPHFPATGASSYATIASRVATTLNQILSGPSGLLLETGLGRLLLETGGLILQG